MGLGNPGKEYETSPHNAGFLCIDEICRRYNISLKKMRNCWQGRKSEIQGKPVLLSKPMTYMNESGYAVQDLVKGYEIEPSHLYLIYDDIDLPLGCIRIREKGSSGTHKGMKSVVRYLGRQDFPRIRIGIKTERISINDIVDYVLSPVHKKDKENFCSGIQTAADAIEFILNHDISKAMNQYNRRDHSLLLTERLDEP